MYVFTTVTWPRTQPLILGFGLTVRVFLHVVELRDNPLLDLDGVEEVRLGDSALHVGGYVQLAHQIDLQLLG